ncbi:hypothetical protein FQN54_005509 [Arachnomyces sp. PD_36]|nr:hypothetical protein FQN54_005509 [Arachnomyces sp. PD_36]
MTLFGKEKEAKASTLDVERPSSDGKSVASSYEAVHGAPSGSSKILGVYHTRSHYSLRVKTVDKSPLYYVDNSTFRIGTPDVTMHVGDEKTGPIKAACKFVSFSSGSKMCLGDPKDTNAIWEDLTKENTLDHSKYRWEMTIPGHGYGGERKAFLWKRTHSVGVGDSKPGKLSTRNFKLVDEVTGEILAVFANNGPKSYSKLGKFEIFPNDYGEDWETLMLLSGLSLIEKERRRARQRSNGGGGGGDGGG